MVTLTELAAKEVKLIMASQSIGEPAFLRVGVKGGGCAGFNFTLDLTDHKDEQDEEFESHGVTVICDAKSHIYLNGTTVDFKDELMGRGFAFDNPNSTGKCGCGSSFSI